MGISFQEYSSTINLEIFREFYFHETSPLRSFMKIKQSRNGEITLLFTDVGKSCPSREFLMWQICLLTLFAKTKSITHCKKLFIQGPIKGFLIGGSNLPRGG